MRDSYRGERELCDRPGRGQARFEFDQPVEPLPQALREVAVRTGRNVIAPNDLVQSRQAPALPGPLRRKRR